MLALQLPVGRQINIQSKACFSSAFGYGALCCLSDQSLGLFFLLSISYQYLKYKFIFLVLDVVGSGLYFIFMHAVRRNPGLLLAIKLACLVLSKEVISVL